LKLGVDQRAHRLGQLFVNARALRGQGLKPCLASAAQHDAELVEQPTQGVHGGRAHAHPMLAGAMQRQHRLLLEVLDRHAPDVALLRRQPDRARIGRVVLVASHEGPDLSGR
jgi:hypothetical protein